MPLSIPNSFLFWLGLCSCFFCDWRSHFWDLESQASMCFVCYLVSTGMVVLSRKRRILSLEGKVEVVVHIVTTITTSLSYMILYCSEYHFMQQIHKEIISLQLQCNETNTPTLERHRNFGLTNIMQLLRNRTGIWNEEFMAQLNSYKTTLRRSTFKYIGTKIYVPREIYFWYQFSYERSC